jgi:hypothetical protein
MLICAAIVALLRYGDSLYRLTALAVAYSQGRVQVPSLEELVYSGSSGSRTPVHVAFSTRDITAIREHYAPQYRNLPAGPPKKYPGTGKLPPGWRQKMTPMPRALERQLGPLPAGYERGVFEGQAVIFRPRGLIYDAVVLF